MHGNVTLGSFLTSALLLSEPVRFIKQLEDTTFIVGQPLKLVCTYTGSPRVSVTWKKDGKLIWASYQYNMKSTDSACVLDILSSDGPNAAGTYSCEISNSAGKDVCHAHVRLTFSPSPVSTTRLVETTATVTEKKQQASILVKFLTQEVVTSFVKT